MVVCRIKEKIDIYIHETPGGGSQRSCERGFMNIKLFHPEGMGS